LIQTFPWKMNYTFQNCALTRKERGRQKERKKEEDKKMTKSSTFSRELIRINYRVYFLVCLQTKHEISVN
jgi:hypothetical protein